MNLLQVEDAKNTLLAAIEKEATGRLRYMQRPGIKSLLSTVHEGNLEHCAKLAVWLWEKGVVDERTAQILANATDDEQANPETRQRFSRERIKKN